MANINFEKIISQIKQKIENMNLKDKWYRVKQAIENMNLKDKWSKFKLTLDQIPIPKWMLVIMTFVSVVVAIASFVSKSPTSKSYNNIVENKRSASLSEIPAPAGNDGIIAANIGSASYIPKIGGSHETGESRV